MSKIFLSSCVKYSFSSNCFPCWKLDEPLNINSTSTKTVGRERWITPVNPKIKKKLTWQMLIWSELYWSYWSLYYYCIQTQRCFYLKFPGFYSSTHVRDIKGKIQFVFFIQNIFHSSDTTGSNFTCFYIEVSNLIHRYHSIHDQLSAFRKLMYVTGELSGAVDYHQFSRYLNSAICNHVS